MQALSIVTTMLFMASVTDAYNGYSMYLKPEEDPLSTPAACVANPLRTEDFYPTPSAEITLAMWHRIDSPVGHSDEFTL